jgi:transcriptional regulator with XRE-family HTH domain
MKIGPILKELRSIKNVSQGYIAGRLNIERSTYAKWESGKVTLKVYQLKALSDIYGIDLVFMAKFIEAGEITRKKELSRHIFIQEVKEGIKSWDDYE